MAIAPMTLNGQPMGLLGVRSVGEVRQFTDDELALLRGLADEAALAITNARLFEALQRELGERRRAEEALRQHASRAEALADLSAALVQATLDLPNVLNTTAQRTADLIGDACVITFLSDDGQWLQPVAFHHPDCG